MTEPANDSEGPFSIGSPIWPGLTKLGEEAAETIQVIMKLMATGGRTDHWSGEDLAVRLEEELGDLRAAIEFVIEHNGEHLHPGIIQRRTFTKRTMFNEWHGKPSTAPKPDHFHDGRPCYVTH